MSDSINHLRQFFKYDHLPVNLQDISRPCGVLAEKMVAMLPADSPEVAVGLRKLLEAKDCFVRARLVKP